MIRQLLLISIALMVLQVRASAAEPFRIRVLTYNIHHAEGTDRKIDLPRIASVIRSVSPDVVALQEVDRSVKRSGSVDQPSELALLTGMKVVFGRNIELQGGHYGNAVLSKFPIIKHENVHLESIKEGEQRGVLVCELQPKSIASPIRFLCTHLDHRSDNQERLLSAKRINQLALEYGTGHAILAGDLNATRDNRVLKSFAQQWKIANKTDLPTVPVGKPRKQIDFILSRPADHWRTIEARVLDEPIASDHRAIFAELELKSNEK